MKPNSPYKRIALTIGMIVCLGCLLTRCINRQNDEAVTVKKPDARQFAGSASCANCHQEYYKSHLHTAHYNTSRPASANSIKGSFEPGRNSFSYNEKVKIVMEKRDSGFYQVAYTNGSEKLARRFDIVMGSGAKGQTSAFWSGNHLFQLPITYFTAVGEWSNSPGYPQKAVFNRPITSRCMECHSTYANVLSADGAEPEQFEKNSILYGVDCEKCHGPGADHVSWQTTHPADTGSRYMVNPVKLSRRQQLDACALCHGGKLQKTKPSFSFVAGDKLSDYFTFDANPPDPDQVDLHGNQYGLLRASKCFMVSETMTCSTCHSSHENERGKTELFSQRCISCHNTGGHGNGKVCKMTASLGRSISLNCIDCHMPAKASRAIAVFLPGASAPVSAYIRSHYIQVYQEETKKFLDKQRP